MAKWSYRDFIRVEHGVKAGEIPQGVSILFSRRANRGGGFGHGARPPAIGWMMVKVEGQDRFENVRRFHSGVDRESGRGWLEKAAQRTRDALDRHLARCGHLAG